MNKDKILDFLNYISDNIKNKDNPIIHHNKIYNNYWNNNRLDIECLIEKLYNQIKPIIMLKNQKLEYTRHIKWTPIVHQYPICYLHYIETESKSDIDFETFNEKSIRGKSNQTKISIINFT